MTILFLLCSNHSPWLLCSGALFLFSSCRRFGRSVEEGASHGRFDPGRNRWHFWVSQASPSCDGGCVPGTEFNSVRPGRAWCWANDKRECTPHFFARRICWLTFFVDEDFVEAAIWKNNPGNPFFSHFGIWLCSNSTCTWFPAPRETSPPTTTFTSGWPSTTTAPTWSGERFERWKKNADRSVIRSSAYSCWIEWLNLFASLF